MGGLCINTQFPRHPSWRGLELSKTTRLAGATLLALGVALSIVSFRLAAREKPQADNNTATAAPKEGDAADAEELRSMERRARQAAAIEPLVNAVKMKVDDDTFIDLFDSEEWWRSYRNEFSFVRLIVDGTVVATRGTVDVGTLDRPVVKTARRQGIASSSITIGNRPFLLAAAQIPISPDHPPIIVLGREATIVPAASVRAAAPPPAPSPLRFWPTALGGALALAGVGLMLFRRRAGGTDPVAEPIPRTAPPMQQFWSPQQEAANPPVVSQTESGPLIRTDGIPGAVPMMATGPLSGPLSGPVGAPLAMLGRYRLLNRLGEGGMAELFIAEVTGVEGFSRTFVLKRLRPELAAEKEAVAQFVEEARLQASLVHSNIVPVFDFGMAGSQYFMTQEYIIGKDLARLMERHQQLGARGLPPDVTYFIAHEVLQALAYAHDTRDNTGAPMGIVHRDVSASNVMVSFQGEIKLSDFGIVKSNRRISKTQVGMVKGNANFMAPEQARGNSVDGRSDLFSLGLLLYYCLTGELLYWGDNDLEVLHRAATGPTPQDIAGIMGLPEPAASILSRALALDPADRFQSAAEFAETLAPHVGAGKYTTGRLMQQLFATEIHRHRQSA
jgi:Protein kinase domain